MRMLGWIFLIGFLMDAVASTLSNWMFAVVSVSSLFSMGMMAFSALVFVLSARGKLLPRKVFLTLTLYHYGVVIVFGIVMIVLLINKVGMEEFTRIGAEANSGSRLFRSQFAWFDAFHLPILAGWIAFAIYGLIAYAKYVHQAPACAKADCAEA